MEAVLVRLSARKGLSTVVTSAILLTAIAVMGATMVTWSNSKLNVFETSLANTTASNTNRINENLNIENVAYCSSSPSCYNGASSNPGVNITLTNTSTLGLTISRLQINGTDYTSFVGPQSSETKLPAIVKPQQSVLLVTSPLGWTKGKTVSTITVTTARGSIFTTQAAP